MIEAAEQDWAGPLSQAVEKGKTADAEELTRQALQHTDPQEILLVLQEALRQVGVKFQEQLIYLPEMFLAARTMQACSDLIKPVLIDKGHSQDQGRIVLGTVEFDIHDIGKNIVKTVLEAAGFLVHDIGVNCSAEKFIAELQKNDADILAMSSLLTITMPSIKKVIKALKTIDLDHPIRTLVGGAPITRSFADEVGADGYAPDAFQAVGEARRLMDEIREVG